MGTAPTVLTEEAATDRSYTVVVAVANPNHVDQLMRTAIDVATARDGRIRVVSVAHKHASSPFRLFSDDRIKREFADDRRAVLDDAVAVGESASVPVEQRLLVGSDVSEALLSAVDAADADALLLGWQDQPRPADIVLGTTVDPVVRRAPCTVYVERIGTTADSVEQILLPADGGPHMGPAVELAEAIARANDATVTVRSYVSPDDDPDDARDHVQAVTTRLQDVTVDADVKTVDDAADAIVADGATRDVVVLGATRERQFRNRVVGSVAASVGQRITVPLVIAKRPTGDSLVDRVRALWPRI
ncbi:universal stress protein [Halopiger goleimassiliensis]|uniref:universal stress protein n=1 Tax=Halopiger goleimassiliensis TaxID=1293048 RepID=UPI0006778E09|nr:universal stress protein [Halopiger goleimassiliensis]